MTRIGIGFILVCLYISWSFEILDASEMGLVLFFNRFYTTVGPGWTLYPKWFFRLIRIPTLQIPITLDVPITTAEADRADFFVGGVRKKFKELPLEEQAALREDPLSHRSEIVVNVGLLLEFDREWLYDFTTMFKNFDEFGKQLGMVTKNTLEGLLSRVTVNTVLEEKEELQPLFSKALRGIISKPGRRSWGFRLTEVMMGPVELREKIGDALTDASAAFAEKKRMIVLGEGHGQALGAVAKYIKSDAGRMAAGFEVSEKIAEAAKLIVAPGFSGLMAAGSEALDSIKNLK